MVNKPLIRPYFLGGVALGGAARIPLTKGQVHTICFQLWKCVQAFGSPGSGENTMESPNMMGLGKPVTPALNMAIVSIYVKKFSDVPLGS